MSMKERLRALSPLKLAFAAVNAVLVLLCAVSALGYASVAAAPKTIAAAEAFRGESGQRFAQLGCFLAPDQGKSVEDILSFRQTLSTRFVEESLEAPEGGRLFLDAYSAQEEVTAATDHGAVTLSAIGVGGEFFYFHPLRLRSGTYLSERDLMDDRVVLDEAMAWRLFGGTDLAGLTLHINGQPFVVAGVVALDEDFATKRADTQEGRLFLSYAALDRLFEDLTIDCYEIVLPDPISGYAKGIVEESFGEAEIVENSGRFAPGRLWDVLGDFGERSMRTIPMAYPYWENALRLAEDYGVLLLLLSLLFALCPAVTAACLLIGGIVRAWRWVRVTLPARLAAAREAHLEELFANNTEGDHTNG